MTRRYRIAGFTLIELLVVIAIIALLVSLLLPAIAKARKSAREAKCMSQMNQYTRGVFQYASDHKDRFATYSWRFGQNYNYRGIPGIAAGLTDDAAAARVQMNTMLKALSPVVYEQTAAFIPHLNLSAIMMEEYLTERVPSPITLCPEDAYLRNERDKALAARTATSINYARSSYQLPVPFFAPDRRTATTTLDITNNGTVGVSPGAQLGRRKLGEVVFPSQKAMFYEQLSWHEARPTHFSLPIADNLVIAADGACRRIFTRDVNRGGFITTAGSIIRQNITYTPIADQGQPPVPAGMSATNPIRWLSTLDGLKGVDWGGSEPYANGN